jgi:DNA-binding MarR family transcriptional regulator
MIALALEKLNRHANRHARRRRPRVVLGRRAKVFGFGNSRPLKPEMKNRLTAEARKLTRPTEPGMHYGRITAKQLEVFRALLWKFHNCVTGWCFPSYEKIAEEVGCHRDTVHQAIAALEAAGLLTWDHRIKRSYRRVLRTSNGYRFEIPPHLRASKSEIISGTEGQELFSSLATPVPRPKPMDSDLAAALMRLGSAIRTASPA